MMMSHAQFEALFCGLDWRRVRAMEAGGTRSRGMTAAGKRRVCLFWGRRLLIWYILVMLDAAELSNDIADLKAMLVAAEARNQRKDERIAQLEKLVAAFRQVAFGAPVGKERSGPVRAGAGVSGNGHRGSPRRRGS